jgi:hypothetical protein
LGQCVGPIPVMLPSGFVRSWTAGCCYVLRRRSGPPAGRSSQAVGVVGQLDQAHVMYHGVNLTGRPLAVDLRSGPRPDGWQESAPFAGDLASAGMAAATTATDALRHELEHPAAAMHALGVLQDAKMEQLAARLRPGRCRSHPVRLRTRPRAAARSGSGTTAIPTRWRGSWPQCRRASIGRVGPAAVPTRGEAVGVRGLACCCGGPGAGLIALPGGAVMPAKTREVLVAVESFACEVDGREWIVQAGITRVRPDHPRGEGAGAPVRPGRPGRRGKLNVGAVAAPRRGPFAPSGPRRARDARRPPL